MMLAIIVCSEHADVKLNDFYYFQHLRHDMTMRRTAKEAYLTARRLNYLADRKQIEHVHSLQQKKELAFRRQQQQEALIIKQHLDRMGHGTSVLKDFHTMRY